MQLNLIIRKDTLSNLADYRYWGSADSLLSMPLSDASFLKLIDYFQSAAEYKTHVNEIATYLTGTSYHFFTNPSEPLVGYALFGTTDLNFLFSAIRNHQTYDTYINKRNILYTEFGWTLGEERLLTIESENIESTDQWSNLPATFDQVKTIYETAVPLIDSQGI